MSPLAPRSHTPVPAIATASRVAAALALVLLSGCSGAPAPADGSGAAARPAAGAPGVWRPAKPDTNGPIVAVIGSKRLLRRDVDSVIAMAPSDVQERLRTFDGYRQLVERLTLEEAMLHAAEESHIERDPSFLSEVARATRLIKLRTYYNRRVEAVPPPTDSMARASYEAHLDQYKIPTRVRIRHIQLATQSEAKTVRRLLEKGSLWDETCKARSKDAVSKDRGGMLGFITKDSDMVPGVGKSPAIVAAAFELNESEISQPLKSEKGWHLIRADEREEATVQSFDEVKARILSELKETAADEFSTRLTDSLRSAAGTVIFDDSITVAISPHKTAADYFKEAQAGVDALDRIALYKQMIKRFPNDSATVQARFMIGFTYAEDLEDYPHAREAFQEFLRLYPDVELAASAKWMLENMDKPPPPMQEDSAPPDSTSAPPGTGGGKVPERARYDP